MRSLFEKNLLRVKRELTDLKTAHKRGLGTVKFFKYTVTFTASLSGTALYYVKAGIKSGEPQRPYVQASSKSSRGDYATFEYDITSGTSEVEVIIESWRQNHTITCEIISSSELENVRFDHAEPL